MITSTIKTRHWSPFIFRKKGEPIRLELKDIFQKRWIEVQNRLHIKALPSPQFEVKSSFSEAYHLRGVIGTSPSLYKKSDEERCYTIDHEIAHYIQYYKNPKMNEVENPKNIMYYLREILCALFGDWSDWYWIKKGRLTDALARKAFREGFATYVASITSGILNPVVEKVIPTIRSGKRWKILLNTEPLPYALGYLTYCAIEKTQSEKQAIQLGLSEDFSKWVSEGRVAFIKLGKPHII